MDTRQIRLRKLSFLSTLDFGQHSGKSVQQIIDIGDWSYLVWIYYNAEKISFIDEVKEEIFLHGDRLIEKPGKDPGYFKENKDKFYEDYRSRKIGSTTEKGRSKAGRMYTKDRGINKSKRFHRGSSKSKDTSRNQGHGV